MHRHRSRGEIFRENTKQRTKTENYDFSRIVPSLKLSTYFPSGTLHIFSSSDYARTSASLYNFIICMGKLNLTLWF
jgi:hypothetical protein